ncbi:hypothetical protein [uncultured Ilyobacter sp.]|nr:hypothetical protein [uncultured Ilyobacter sp.]
MEILKLSLYLTIMLGMTVYFKKQVSAKSKRSAVPVKKTEGRMK